MNDNDEIVRYNAIIKIKDRKTLGYAASHDESEYVRMQALKKLYPDTWERMLPESKTSEDICITSWHNLDVSWPEDDPGYGSFVDPRDGQEYKTVKIGNQVWMAENFNYNGGGNCWTYKDEPQNAEINGRLYDWETAIRAAPEGWHLPSMQEWEILMNLFGGQDEH